MVRLIRCHAHLFCVWFAVAVNDKALRFTRGEEFEQMGRKRYASYACFRLSIAYNGFVFAECNHAAYMYNPFFCADIFPPQPVYFARAHAGEHQKRLKHSVVSVLQVGNMGNYVHHFLVGQCRAFFYARSWVKNFR